MGYNLDYIWSIVLWTFLVTKIILAALSCAFMYHDYPPVDH